MISILLHSGPGLDDYSLHLANALSEFARVGYSIDVRQRDRYGESLSSRVTPLIFHRPRQREIWGIQEMVQLSRAIFAFQPDLFHIQGDGLWESFLINLLGDLPVIATIHDPVKHIDQNTILNNLLMKNIVQQACGWVVHSEGLKDILLERFHLNPNFVLVHPHGILDYYNRYKSINAQREKIILFFGELRFNKGCDLLLHAFDSVSSQLDGWRLIVAGRGIGLKNEQALVERLGAQLEFRERFIEDDEVADLFTRAGIVVLPYRHGSQSGVLAIAAAFGCPVLATRVGSLTELVKDQEQVLFVEPENESSLTQGLLLLMENDALRSDLGRKLRELAQNEWSWKKIAQKTVQFYEKILSINE